MVPLGIAGEGGSPAILGKTVKNHNVYQQKKMMTN